MKKLTGITVLFVSIVMTTIGSVLKVYHALLADLFLGAGMAAFVIAIALIVARIIQKKKTHSEIN